MFHCEDVRIDQDARPPRFPTALFLQIMLCNKGNHNGAPRSPFSFSFFLSAANPTPTGCTKGALQERQDSPPLCVGALIDRGGAKSGHAEEEKGPVHCK